MSWSSVALGEVAEIVTGKTPETSDQSNFGGDVPFVTPAELDGPQPISVTPRTLSAKGARSLKTVPQDSVLVCCIGSLGKVGISGRVLATNQQINSVVFDPKLVHARFGYHACRTLKATLEAIAPATTVKIVTKARFSDLAIPLPPLEEQKRIAAILDQADALRRLRRRALDHLDNLGQAIFHKMFVASAGDWPHGQIDAVVSNVRTGPFGSQLLHSEFVDAGVPVLGIDNVVTNEFVWAQPRFITEEKYRGLSRYAVEPGDVLITIMGTCGRCAIVPDDIPTAINTKHICCLTPNRAIVSSEYLRAVFLMHPAVLRQLGVQAKGAVMPGLNMGIIKKTEIPVPPRELQHQFDQRLKAARNEAERSQRQAGALERLFSSLQHRAFIGIL